MDMLRILGRKSGNRGDRDDGQSGPVPTPKPIDGQLHVLVSRSTTVTSSSTAAASFPSPPSTMPAVSARVTTTRQEAKPAPRPRLREKRDTMPPLRTQISSDAKPSPSPRIDEQMHVLTGRPRPSVSPVIPTADLPPRRASATATTAAGPPQPRIRASTIPIPPAAQPAAPPSQATSRPPPTSSTPTTPSDVSNIIRRLRPAPIPPNAPPAIIAGCIAEVLGIPDVHGVLEYLEQQALPSTTAGVVSRSRSENGSVGSRKSALFTDTPSPYADMVPRLAIKAKGLFEDNKRMHAEIRSLHAEKADLEAQLKRVQSAMENMVRVAEIMNVQSRFTPPSSPPSELLNSNTSTTGASSVCGACGSVCPTCSPGVSSPIMDRGELVPNRTRWSMQPKRTMPKDFPSMDDEQHTRLTILPPPPRLGRVSSADSASSPTTPITALPRPSSIHLGDADCGVSLNRFKAGDDDECTDDETEHLMVSDIEECSQLLSVSTSDDKAVKPVVDGDVEKPNIDKPIVVEPKELPPAVEVEFGEPFRPDTPLFESIKSSDDIKQSRGTSVMICECECDGNSVMSTTTDTADVNSTGSNGSTGPGDLIVVKTGFKNQSRNRMSMSLDPKSQSILKVKMVHTTLVRRSSGDVSSLSASTSTVSVATEPNVDEQAQDQDENDDDNEHQVSRATELQVPIAAEDVMRNEPDGYPWW